MYNIGGGRQDISSVGNRNMQSKSSSYYQMDAVVCKKCRQLSSVTPSTRRIRCLGCGEIIPVLVSSAGMMSKSLSQDDGDDNITRTIRSLGCREIIPELVSVLVSALNQDDDGDDNINDDINVSVTTEGKGLPRICKKISTIVYPKTTVRLNLCPSVRISDTPPRGKRALLCGVSYKNKKFRLKGTIQDIMYMGELLINTFRFPPDSILILAEDGQYEAPTKNNILRAFEWLMKDLRAGDSLVFYYSGRGLRQIDFNRDEIDGFDEAICPLDFETQGLILDNDINELIVRPLKPGVRLHAIIDACHSGTVLDLPHVYDQKERRWNGNHPPSGRFKGTSGGQAICFSACEDHQQAADTSAFSPERTMAGAMTHNFIQAITENQRVTYLGIMDIMAKAIEVANDNLQGRCVTGGMLRLFHRKMLQNPLLSSSEPFNVNSRFELQQHF